MDALRIHLNLWARCARNGPTFPTARHIPTCSHVEQYLSCGTIWEDGCRQDRSERTSPAAGMLWSPAPLHYGAAVRINPRPYLLFRHPRPHRGGGEGLPAPSSFALLIATELRNTNDRKALDVMNLTISDFATLSYILIFQGRSNKTKNTFGKINVFCK